ncbi:hypothetical protein [Fervidibacillus halotolerans]|uniref:Uncharacterized protein n=1 Tax=Fervidibacillus halotolerans TaxID=2980027 RepID=A0A9E8M0B1_9BACI|nr:hypothetical protein [Fervidibacillus halotolerans]WAA12874.1 hypothetical protein OE105_01630 [Fervidibacillus halotolerans]
MLKIKVKTAKQKIFIPIPYGLLKIAIIFLSSEHIRKRLANLQREEEKETMEGNRIETDGEHENNKKVDKKERPSSEVCFAPEMKKILKLLLKELRRYRGLELISVQSKDTFVSIKL